MPQTNAGYNITPNRTYNWQEQPYVSWKGESSNSAVPTWSRPLPIYDKKDNGPSFKARPIKHWRKQLNPRAYSGRGRAGVGMPMDTPGGSVYLGSDSTNCIVCNSNDPTDDSNSAGLKENILYEKNLELPNKDFKFLNGNTYFKSVACVACNPEANVIKSATTILNKNYYTDSRAYLRAKGKTYEQKLTGNRADNVNYFDANGKLAWPDNSKREGPQVRTILDCQGNTASECDITIYKPSNRQFATQGAVSSSARLLRLQINTINNNGSSFTSAIGAEAANAGKYHGTSNAPYILKNKMYVCKPKHRNGDHTNCWVTPTGDVGTNFNHQKNSVSVSGSGFEIDFEGI